MDEGGGFGRWWWGTERCWGGGWSWAVGGFGDRSVDASEIKDGGEGEG